LEEELNLNSSIENKDIEKKDSAEIDYERFTNSKMKIHIDNSGEEERMIDEIIRQHSSENSSSGGSDDIDRQETEKKLHFSKNDDLIGSSSSESDPLLQSSEKVTPKVHLLKELKKLGDAFGSSSLYDKELFLQDLDHILKILSFDEILENVLPIFQIF